MRDEPLVSRLRPYTQSVFPEMTALAVRHEAVNLGQGFPDTDGPSSMLAAAREAISSGQNQYPPGPGRPELREAIAAHRGRYGLDYDPGSEVLVTVGATEAVSAAMLGLVQAGDEVLLLEPYYDSYPAAVALAGAERRVVPLRSDGGRFCLDVAELRAAVTSATRAVVVNSPHNPTGAVLTAAELAGIAEVCVEHDLIAVTDEVYEHLTFDGAAHRPLATFPGMRERTVSISSAAKSFNVTGWKIGWVAAPSDLLAAVKAAKQFLTFVGGGPFQPAIAHALNHELPWVSSLRESLQAKRTRLRAGLAEAGFGVARSEGTYFVCADTRPLGYDDATELAWALPEKVGVAAVPLGVFTDHPGQWSHLLRFAFCKRAEVLDEAIKRLGLLGR
jgi:N-succinyldiaminopimelate aminotransferase